MKFKTKKGYKRVIAFIVALTTIASIGVASSFAVQSENKEAITNHVDDYTNLLPSLTDTKMKLSDPVFSEKDWYEYIEYEEYSEVVDGDMIYRIYKPTDFSAASIMAIGDYDPSEILGNTTNLSMNLGELQGIFDMAQQGSNISKDFAGLNIASGIGENMTNIGDVMDNSKYYSNASFLGIPGDGKYQGVSNEGFFNADSLDIEIVESETISTCKTVAINSEYSISDSTKNEKTHSIFNEVSNIASNTHSEETYTEDSNTAGLAISDSTSHSFEISNSITNSLGWEMVSEIGSSHTESEISSQEFGVEVGYESDGIAKLAAGKIQGGLHYNNSGSKESSDTTSSSLSIGSSGSVSSETGSSLATGSEHSISTNIEKTNSTGKSSGDSSTIEHGLTSGGEEGTSYEHANEMAVGIGYGVDYQYGNEHSLSIGVTRTFNAREDKEVKNVGWKLCEYIVKVPYYIEAIKVDAAGDETVLYGQYVNYNLLNGVSRVFANGYIEHWYTGELVTYADFFDGFVTASELVDKAKAQQAEKFDSFS